MKQSLSSNSCQKIFFFRNDLFAFRLSNRRIKLLVYALISYACIAIGVLLLLHPDLHKRAIRKEDYGDSENEKRLPQRNMTLIFKSTSERQQARLQHVRDACAKLNSSDRLLTKNTKPIRWHFTRFIVDDQHRVIYCSISKVASTNWKRVLLVLTGKMNTTLANGLEREVVHKVLLPRFLRSLRNYTMDAIQHRLKTYYKFMFVRDPFERLLSAFVDRFQTTSGDRYRKWYGQQIVRQYRRNASDESLRLGHDVAFEEFVSYLLDPKTKLKKPFDIHWREYHALCHPCFVDYDFIGKYETLREDADFVLHQLGIGEKVTFPTAGRPTVKTSEILAEKYSQISAADIYRLWKLYSIDFDLFDYPYPNFNS